MLSIFTLLLIAGECLGAPTDLGLEANDGYVKLNARKLRGSSYSNAAVGAEARFIQKRDSNGNLEMVLSNQDTFYQAELQLGSNKQKVGVLVDTGSSDLWVISSNNTGCSSNSGSNSGSGNTKTAGGYASSQEYGTEYETETEYGTSDNGFYDTMSELESQLATMTNWKGISKNHIQDLNALANNNLKPTRVQEKGLISDILNGKSSTLAPQATLSCNADGSFDESKSSTFKSNDTEFSITYADDTFAKGTWGHDTVVINGVSVSDLSMAVCDNTDNKLGVLGIGLAGLETTYGGSDSASSTSDLYQYENLPLKLKTLGIIKSAMYSVYLNDTDASQASVLFGAVDQDKYEGDLNLFPIINSVASYGYKNPIRIEITLSSLTVGSYSRKAQVKIASGAAAALLDTGTTLTYVPSSVLKSIINLLQPQYNSNVGYYMQCSEGSTHYITFNFQGVDFRLPLSTFMVPLTTTSGGSSSYCMLGFQSSGDASFTLGDSFLRNVYFAVDLAHYQVGMALAKLNSTSESIKVVSDTIPSVKSASGWSSTYGLSSETALSTMAYSTESVTYTQPSSNNGGAVDSGSATGSSQGDSSPSGSSTSGSSSSSSSSRSKGDAPSNYAPGTGMGWILVGLGILSTLF